MTDPTKPTSDDSPEASLPPIDADLTPAQIDRLLAPLNKRERKLLLARLKRSEE